MEIPVWLVIFWVVVLPFLAAFSWALSTEWWTARMPRMKKALQLPVFIYVYGLIALGIWGLIG